MSKRPKKTSVREDYDAVIAMLEGMPRVKATDDGPYTHVDRARDFTTVFSTEVGQRVLSQIHQICDPPSTIKEANQGGTLAFKAGMRRVMGEIMLCFVPKQPVTIEEKDPRS